MPRVLGAAAAGNSSRPATRSAPSPQVDAAKTYEALKAQLVTLSIEIEDRTQAAELLRSAIDAQNQKLDGLSGEVEEMYLEKIEAAKRKHAEELSAQVEKIERLLQEKQELTGRTRSLVEDIKKEEAETTAVLKSVRAECADELQKAHQTWGEGEVARRDRWISRKTEEVRERTVKGLEPEIQRIIDQHKSDVDALEAQQHEEERALRKQMSDKYDKMVEAAQQRIRAHMEVLLEAERDSFGAKANKLIDEHQHQLHKLRGKLAADKEAQRKWHVEELRRHQEKHATEIARLQASHQSKLQSLREKFQEEKDALNRHHRNALEAQKKEVSVEREEWEARMRQRVVQDQETHVEKERVRLARHRDAEIEKTIHTLQSENVVFERRCKAAFDAMLAQARADYEAEKLELLQEADGVLRRYGEEVSRQHQSAEELARVKTLAQERGAHLEALEKELKQARKEIEAAQKDLSGERQRLQDRENEEERRTQRKLDELHAAMAVCEKDMEAAEADKARRKREADEDHERTLHQLHLEVKSKVEDLDGEAAKLREALATAKLKRDHIDKLLEQYQKRTVASATKET